MKKGFVALGLSLGLIGSSFSGVTLAKSNDLNINKSNEFGTPNFVSGKLAVGAKEQAMKTLMNYLNEHQSMYHFAGSAEQAFKVT